MLEVTHEVVITMVKSTLPLTQPLTSTQSQFNISCTNECVSQASQSLIEQKYLEYHELNKEVERLRKDVIRLKGKDKAQPSQDNRDNMVKKLEKGSNLALPSSQQMSHLPSNDKATKSKKLGKRMCYGCGLYGHESAMCPHKTWGDKCEVAEHKASTKVANQMKNDGPSNCVKRKSLDHPTKHCPLSIEAGKKAQVTTRRCYGCNEVGHMIYKCPNKQSKHKANQGRICYACKRKGHLSYDCPNGNFPKPNTYGYHDMLRKGSNGVSTRKVMCSPHVSTKDIWVPKHLLTNPNGPNKSWVPKCA
jgi:hypothetical protein